MRFPEVYAALRHGKGAHVFTVPSAFTKPTGKAHWSTLLRSRAIEQQCYVIASAQCGKHSEKRESYGHSMIVDPWGEVVADLGPDQEGIACCDLDMALLNNIRERMPIGEHRGVGRNALGWD